MIGIFTNPQENDVLAGTQVTVQIKVTADAGQNIVSANLFLLGQTALPMTFDPSLNVWKRLIALTPGPMQVRVEALDNASTVGKFYLNFSNSTSLEPPAFVNITNPVVGQDLHVPGVLVQADVTRVAKISRVELSTNKGATWQPMALPFNVEGDVA